MSVLRWLVTIVSYPIGGLIAIQVSSTTAGPPSAALGGALAGAVIGTAQWLALRPRVNALWVAVTSGSFGVGAALGVAATASATTIGALATYGAIAGLVVGIGQSVFLRIGWRSAVWAATVAVTWAVAWIVSATVIVDEARGFVTFGLSGAAIVVAVSAVALRLLIGPRVSGTAQAVTV